MAYGERSRAEELIQQELAAAMTEHGEDSPQVQLLLAEVAYSMACRHARVGEREEAIRELEQAVDLAYNEPEDAERIASDPNFESLHGDPEFEAIVAEVKKRAGEK